MTPGLDDLAQPGIDALGSVGGVDHFPDGRREDEEGNHSIPGASPRCNDRWILLAPGPAFKLIECLLSRFGVDGLVDQLERLGQSRRLSQAAKSSYCGPGARCTSVASSLEKLR